MPAVQQSAMSGLSSPPGEAGDYLRTTGEAGDYLSVRIPPPLQAIFHEQAKSIVAIRVSQPLPGKPRYLNVRSGNGSCDGGVTENMRMVCVAGLLCVQKCYLAADQSYIGGHHFPPATALSDRICLLLTVSLAGLSVKKMCRIIKLPAIGRVCNS